MIRIIILDSTFIMLLEKRYSKRLKPKGPTVPRELIRFQLHSLTAYFPKLWKITRVSPIPKVDNPTTYDELRPISILPVLSKVFERLVGWQMSEFTNSASLLYDNISSFRKGQSTTTALLGIRDVFSKAFDTVRFKTTLKKFPKLGFTKNYLK